MTELYAVLGNPIAQSKSPYIHGEFAKQTLQDISYQAIQPPVDQFESTLRTFIKQGAKGANVTAPFKEQAFTLCDELSELAKLAGAVNTLSFTVTGKIIGDNTDGVGLVNDLQIQFGSLEGKRILLVGAGGAARGCILPLLQSNISKLVICNRTYSKAKQLALLFNDFGNVCAENINTLNDEFDIVINSTSAGLSGELAPLPESVIGKNTMCYDMTYGKKLTLFNHWAQSVGAIKTADGLGMLVGQAAKSFSIWRGVMPDPQIIMTTIRQQMT